MLSDTTIARMTRGMAAGEPDAIRAFYDAYAGWMLTAARRSKRDEAFCLDVVHDAAVRVIEKIRPFDREDAFRVWLGRVVMSCVIDRVRSELRRVERERRHAATTQALARAAAPLDDLEQLQRRVLQLSQEQWTLLRLRFAAKAMWSLGSVNPNRLV